MYEHPIQHPTTEPRPAHSRPIDGEADAMAVGTFAAGQSPQGAFELAAEAELGTFASGVAAREPRQTA